MNFIYIKKKIQKKNIKNVRKYKEKCDGVFFSLAISSFYFDFSFPPRDTGPTVIHIYILFPLPPYTELKFFFPIMSLIFVIDQGVCCVVDCFRIRDYFVLDYFSICVCFSVLVSH